MTTPEIVETLAAQLHREYRAAEKAVNRAAEAKRKLGCGTPNVLLHDHGWSNCSKKSYFRKRAQLIMERADNTNAQCLDDAEEALSAQVLKRRLIVEGKPIGKYDRLLADIASSVDRRQQ